LGDSRHKWVKEMIGGRLITVESADCEDSFRPLRFAVPPAGYRPGLSASGISRDYCWQPWNLYLAEESSRVQQLVGDYLSHHPSPVYTTRCTQRLIDEGGLHVKFTGTICSPRSCRIYCSPRLRRNFAVHHVIRRTGLLLSSTSTIFH